MMESLASLAPMSPPLTTGGITGKRAEHTGSIEGFDSLGLSDLKQLGGEGWLGGGHINVDASLLCRMLRRGRGIP